MYMGFSDVAGTDRHLSLVPHVPGLEALCGQGLVATAVSPTDQVPPGVNCRACQRVAGQLVRRRYRGPARTREQLYG